VGRRRKAREIVLQALYEHEIGGRPWEEALGNQLGRRGPGPETESFARRLMEVTVRHREELDAEIRSVLENWDFSRVSVVDRNILRSALAELRYLPDVPAAVVINEALEIARKFSTDDSSRFINGILDRLARRDGRFESKEVS
jgi:N utilization substance protein B